LHTTVLPKEEPVQVVDLNHAETFSTEPGLDVAFPIHSATGAAASASVWMEIAPGAAVAEHTDSAEELLYVVQGEVEATIGDEAGTLRAGELALVPAMAPHSLSNQAHEEARVLGFFAGSTNVATFAEPHGPHGARVFVIGGPMPIMLPLDHEVAVEPETAVL
jgi:quercetin dioxygenase-like cupin family protein